MQRKALKHKLEIYTNDHDDKTTTTTSTNQNQIIFGSKGDIIWKTQSDVELYYYLKKALIQKQPNISDAQSHLWPNIINHKNVISIINNQNDLSSIFIVPLINNILKDPSRKCIPDHLGPIGIILTHDQSSVIEIEKKIQDYSNELKIVKAYGKCENKKVELMNGCDLLITVPSAYRRLTGSNSISIIDKERFKYIVFDSFYQMATKFPKDFHNIIKFCFNDALKVPQIIITSEVLSKFIKKVFNTMLPIDKSLIYIEDFLEASVFAGISFKFEEISTSIDEKVEKLIQDPIMFLRRTVIVVNDEATADYVELKFKNENISAIKCTSILNASSKWKDLQENWNILIITDLALKSANITSANYLIHFTLPKNMKIFMQRFQVLTDTIYKSLKSLNSEEKSTLMSTRILLDDQKIMEFEEIMNFMKIRRLPIPKEVLQKLISAQEKIKLEQGVALCRKFLQFGECNKINCVNRHIISSKDKPLSHLPTKDLIKFDIVTIQSPVSFIIKIREHFIDLKWCSLDEKNLDIEQTLDNDFQKYCKEHKSKQSLSKGEGEIGEIYAKFDDKLGKWVRVRIIERINFQVVKLYFIDYGSTSPTSEIKLMDICQEYADLEPLVCKLQIVNLIPIDGASCYEEADTNKLSKMIQKNMKNDTTFLCRIETALFDILFTKTFEVKDYKNKFVFRLENSHLKMGISEVDDQILLKLHKLLSPFHKNILPTNVPKMKSKLRLIEADKKKQVSNEELWKELNGTPRELNESLEEIFYNVTVQDYFNPHSFLITVNNHGDYIRNALKRIEEFSATENLEEFNVGTNCLVKYNGLTARAKILSDQNDNCEILLVDHGKVLTYSKDQLMKMPQDFLSIRFQCVHCSMYKIKPKYNMSIWPPMQRRKIKELLDDYSEENGGKLIMYVIKKDQKTHKFSSLGISAYEVTLRGFSDGEERMLDWTISLNNYATVESDVQSEEDNVVDSIESSDNYQDFIISDELWRRLFLTESDYDQLTDDSQSTSSVNMKSLSPESAENRCSSKMSTSVTCSSISVDATTSNDVLNTDSSSVPSSYISSDKSLNYLMKQPYIEFRQNKYSIYLIVTARDCITYTLKIRAYNMEIGIEYNDKVEGTVLQFYGLIQPRLCSHERRGENIIIRLVKKNFYNWKNLLNHEGKSRYIKFSNEDVPLNISSPYDTPSSTSSESYTYRPDDLSYSESDSEEKSANIEFESSDDEI